MELDLVDGIRIEAMGAEFGLAVMGGGAKKVNWEAIGSYVGGELKQLAQMALRW